MQRIPIGRFVSVNLEKLPVSACLSGNVFLANKNLDLLEGCRVCSCHDSGINCSVKLLSRLQ